MLHWELGGDTREKVLVMPHTNTVIVTVCVGRVQAADASNPSHPETAPTHLRLPEGAGPANAAEKGSGIPCTLSLAANGGTQTGTFLVPHFVPGAVEVTEAHQIL